ncbi:hypothetical protein B0H10DRAFT_2210023 [Mycena sp. CBHHK59/15]|nr:hypothetical protein B0H10DRAFT_2210023 [Mycena sp. CBHHK59/15]
MTKILHCFSDILFPGQYYYNASAWSPKFDYPNNISWDDKKLQLYWCGASDGGHIIGDNYRQFIAKMVVFDEAACTFDCDHNTIIEEYDIGGILSPPEEIYLYKYLLDLDGHTFAEWFLGLLRSGSLVFKSMEFNEYFNDWLQLYKHYVLVKTDLSDLVSKAEWAIANEREVRLIQEMGTQMAKWVLTDVQNNCYFTLVLLEWAWLQSYAKLAVLLQWK